MDALVVPSRSSPQRFHVRRWVSAALALLAVVAVVAVVLHSGPVTAQQLLETALPKETVSPAAIEALDVKNAAVQSAVQNANLMSLISHAQGNKPVSLTSVAALHRLSDGDISEMIRNAESHITSKAQHATAELVETPPAAHPAAAKQAASSAENAGSLGDLKSIASAFEAHLKQEEVTAKALVAQNSGHAQADLPLAAPAADTMATLTAQLDKSEKAEEDKMKGHFLRERQNVIAMFKSHIAATAPAVSERSVDPAATPASHSLHPPHSRKALGNLHMISHLVLGHQDKVNDAQYGDVPEAPRASVADRMIQRLKSGTSDADNDAQYGAIDNMNDPTKSHMPSWVSRLSGHESPSGSGVDEKGLTWRRNYLARLRNVGYRHDEFASDKANPV